MSVAVNSGSAFVTKAGPGVSTDAIWDAAGDLAVGTGADTAAKLTLGASGKALRSTGSTAAWSEVPGQILGRTAYNPGSNTSVSTSSSTLADVDATNLAVTFTVPASGNVEVSLEGYGIGGTASALNWGLREATTDLTATIVMYNGEGRQRCTLTVTGLTPGASKTYKWSHCRSTGAAACTTRYGQSAINTADGGAAVMTVRAL